MKKLVPVITAVAFLIIVLFAAKLLNSEKSQTPPKPFSKPAQVSIPFANTVLTLGKTPVKTGNNQYSLPIDIDTGDNQITAIEIGLHFDPKVIHSVTITPAKSNGFFRSPQILLTRNDVSSTFISFADALGENGKQGSDTVALLTFSVEPSAKGTITQINFTPQTHVTALSHATSVLKATRGTAFRIE